MSVVLSQFEQEMVATDLQSRGFSFQEAAQLARKAQKIDAGTVAVRVPPQSQEVIVSITADGRPAA